MNWLVPQPKVDLLRALLPDPGTDVAQLFRDEDWFAATADALAGLFDPDVESVPAWRGAGTTYSGIDGFREMWLDWLEPWASYHVQVDVSVRQQDDRGRRQRRGARSRSRSPPRNERGGRADLRLAVDFSR